MLIIIERRINPSPTPPPPTPHHSNPTLQNPDMNLLSSIIKHFVMNRIKVQLLNVRIPLDSIYFMQI